MEVACGDFDNDGALDIAVANGFSEKIRNAQNVIYLNDGPELTILHSPLGDADGLPDFPVV